MDLASDICQMNKRGGENADIEHLLRGSGLSAL